MLRPSPRHAARRDTQPVVVEIEPPTIRWPSFAAFPFGILIIPAMTWSRRVWPAQGESQGGQSYHFRIRQEGAYQYRRVRRDSSRFAAVDSPEWNAVPAGQVASYDRTKVVHRFTLRARKMIRELRSLGYRVELLPAPSSNPA